MSRFIALPVALAVLPAAAGATTADEIVAAQPAPASRPGNVGDAAQAARAGRARMGADRKAIGPVTLAGPAATARPVSIRKAIESRHRC